MYENQLICECIYANWLRCINSGVFPRTVCYDYRAWFWWYFLCTITQWRAMQLCMCSEYFPIQDFENPYCQLSSRICKHARNVHSSWSSSILWRDSKSIYWKHCKSPPALIHNRKFALMPKISLGGLFSLCRVDWNAQAPLQPCWGHGKIRMMSALMAVREINNKKDTFHDDVLKNHEVSWLQCVRIVRAWCRARFTYSVCMPVLKLIFICFAARDHYPRCKSW